jgi:hypothetical protein
VESAALAVQQQLLHLAQAAQVAAVALAQVAAVAAAVAAAVLQLHALLQALHVQQLQPQVAQAALVDLAVHPLPGKNRPQPLFFLTICHALNLFFTLVDDMYWFSTVNRFSESYISVIIIIN